MKTKQVDIEYRGKPDKVTIKRLGYAEKMDFIEAAVEYRLIGQLQTTIPHPFKMRVKALQICIVEAPFEHKTTEAINAIEDHEMLDKVWKEIDAFNKFAPKEEKNLEGPSAEGAQTQSPPK